MVSLPREILLGLREGMTQRLELLTLTEVEGMSDFTPKILVFCCTW